MRSSTTDRSTTDRSTTDRSTTDRSASGHTTTDRSIAASDRATASCTGSVSAASVSGVVRRPSTRPPSRPSRRTPWATGRFDGSVGPPRLLFGHTFEDPAIELGLFPPSGRVLCIAAAGDVPLALAAAGLDVVAVDINPLQVAEARRRLTGAPPRSGAADHLLALGRAALVPLGWTRRRLTAFCELDDVDEQREAWLRLASPSVRAALRLALSPRVLRVAYGEPFAKVAPADIADQLLDRIGRRITRRPNRTNPWLALLLTGQWSRPAAASAAVASADVIASTDAPTHVIALTHVVGQSAAASTAAVRSGARIDERSVRRGSVDLRLGDVTDVLERLPAGSLDGITLSNVVDGPAPVANARLLRSARRAGRPGAAIVVRSFVTDGDRRADPLAEPRADEDRSLLWGSIAVHRAEGERS